MPAMAANSCLKLFKPSDDVFGGVECLIDLGASLLGTPLACVRKGPATDDWVPAETTVPMLMTDSDCFEVPLFMLDVSLMSSPEVALRLSLCLARSKAFFLSSSYFFFLGSSGST